MITSPAEFITPDRRFKSWAKKVKSVNLNENGGYALIGNWVKFTDSVAISDGEYLVCAAETGSAKNHPFSYALIGANGRIKGDDVDTVVKTALENKNITDEQYAKSENSRPYKYALYIHLITEIKAKLKEYEKTLPDDY